MVYVDDMIVARDDEHEKKILKEKLVAQFEMKDLGNLKYFLGIEVAYLKKGIFIFQSQGDHTLFIKHSPEGKLTLLLVCVDDTIVAGDDEHEKQILKEKLAAQFEMNDLGKLKYFLRIEVAYSKKGIFISQRKYVIDLLKETSMINCKTTRVPIEQNHIIGSDEGSSTVNKGQYQRLIGKLIYLAPPDQT